MPKAILFDLDDTILSHDGAADSAWEELCASFVESANTPFCSDALMESINKARRWYWSDPERHKTGRMDMLRAKQIIISQAFSHLDYSDEGSAFKLAEKYCRRHEELMHLFPDAFETLESIKSKGIRMALLTNGVSEVQRGKINRFCLSGFFEFCLVEGELGYGKPDIRVFETALEKLGLKAEDVWMVGDNLVWDIQAPQTLGIFSIWNDHDKKGLPEGTSVIPDRIIHSISELLDFLT